MKIFFTFLVSVFIALVLLFCFQNWQSTEVTLAGYSVELPLAIVSIILYSLGALTGSLIFKMLRRGLTPDKHQEKEPEE